MLKWLLFLPLSLLASALCYLTNPIVVLFCDEDGELPGFLSLWQTWDNSCNPSDIMHIAPSWLQYNWAAHYTEHKDADAYLESVNRKRWYTTCVNHDWTLSERAKRYLCRVLWLTRNNAYGFCFYLLGHTATPCFGIVESENTKTIFEVGGVGWEYKNTAPIFKAFGWVVRWENLLGWKLDTSARFDTRAMIANRIAIRFSREGK